MPSILIIDDDAGHRKVVRHLMEKLHPDVDVDEFDSAAPGGLNELTAVGRYVLVILDTTVGGQDGIAWMKTVSQQQSVSPAFIFLSSITDMQSVETTQLLVSAIKLGAVNFFFKKKLDMKHLTHDVNDILDATEQQAQKAAPVKKKAPPTPLKQDEMEDTMTEIGLAMVMMNGDKKLPFTTEDILQGKAFLGHYKIISYLGEDTVASSFEATTAGLNKSVVVKLVNQLRLSGNAIPPTFTEKFNAIKKLHHPNVLHLFNYEFVNRRIVVGIEYLRGGTLEERLKKGKLEQGQAIEYFRQLLDGMSALHNIGLELHEVMPKHLMFRDEDTMVITHLGLLNELHGLSEITGEWTLPQISPVYTAPETVQSHISDMRSDIYLAGLIGFEMMTGKPPYWDGSTQDILYAHAAEPVPTLPDPRHPLNDLLMSMLTKMPEKRVQTAGEALAQLNKIYPALS
jgi:serine/threonine-protein kinase